MLMNRCFVACLALVLVAAASVQARADADYLTELRSRARSINLAADPQWLALGYWMPVLLGPGAASLIDNPAFFLAGDGMRDPAAELDATLAAFFAPPGEDADAHPQCVKVARYRWLKQQLTFDPQRLPERPCPAYRKWLDSIEPGSVSLIFPAAYLNNPSSMFGHTLLRFDPPKARARSALTAHTAHFAADNQGEQGVLFALKGLTGFYQGYFAVMPYYEKVTQYSDIENRDIWEYQLDLKPDQIELMLASLWEVNLQPIDYYFLSTNCSFVLLALLNVARPDLQLPNAFPVYAIPVDTVRAAIEDTGLMRSAAFRPSQRTQIASAWNELGAGSRAIALALASGKIGPEDPELAALGATQRARVLELAQSYLQYRIETGEISRSEMAPRSIALLRARARLVEAPPPAPVTEPATRPEQGHHSARLAVGAGMTGDRPFAEVALRPAYHDLLDPLGGYVPGAAIDFLDVHLRWYESAVPSLDSATLVGIESLTPRDALFRALSWRARLGVDRWRDSGSRPGDIVGTAGGGAGPAWSVGESLRIYGFVDAALLADGHWPDGRLFTVGPAAGILWQPTTWWTIRPEARYGMLVEGGPRNTFEVSLAQGVALGRDLSLQLSVAARNDGDETYGEWLTRFSWYF